MEICVGICDRTYAARCAANVFMLAMMAPGTRLRINAVTQRAGSILVEAAGLDGKPIPGRTFADAVPIVGDQHRTLVTWKNADTHGVDAGKHHQACAYGHGDGH